MKLVPTIFTIAMISNTAMAGGHSIWEGPYVGLSSNSMTDNEVLFDDGDEVVTREMTSDGVGLLAGYNFQNGQILYGAEISYSPLESAGTDHSITRRDYIDLKGRIGYVMNELLVYAALGYSSATLKENENNVDVPTDGISYGVGVDYMITDSIFVGGEYYVRTLKSDYTTSGFPTFTGESDNNSLSLRIGMNF